MASGRIIARAVPGAPGSLQIMVPSETGLATLVRYAFLLALGFGALFVLVLSLIAFMQVVAHTAGLERGAAMQAGKWGFGGAALIAAAPMVRFVVRELPRAIGEGWVQHRKRLAVGVLIALVAAALGWF
jgi:hypothetical protein